MTPEWHSLWKPRGEETRYYDRDDNGNVWAFEDLRGGHVYLCGPVVTAYPLRMKLMGCSMSLSYFEETMEPVL